MRVFTLTSIFAVIGVLIASQAYAGDYPQSVEHQRLDRSGTHMSTTGTRVINPKNRQCNSVVDCRQKGQSLYKISQFNGTDLDSVAQYPSKGRVYNHKAGGYVLKSGSN